MMCDPVREHRFRSCHTVYSILSHERHTGPSNPSTKSKGSMKASLEPLLFANIAWCVLSWCRRTSVRPPDDIEKSVTHRPCAMPLSGNFTIQAKSLLQLHFLFGAIFSTGASPSHIRRIWKTARPNYLKNAGDYQIGIHHPWHVTNGSSVDVPAGGVNK